MLSLIRMVHFSGFFFFLVVSPYPVFGQFIAFSGKDSNSPDEFAFVALTDIPNGTTIFFSSNDWNNGTGQFSDDGEGIVSFTTTAIIPRGTVTQISETGTNSFTVTGGSGNVALVGANAYSTTSGDPHYAWAAANAASPLTTVTEVYAFLDTAPGTIAAAVNPTTGTNNSPNAIVCDFASQEVAVDYNQPRNAATPVTLANPANFLTGVSITLDLSDFSGPGLPVELKSFQIE